MPQSTQDLWLTKAAEALAALSGAVATAHRARRLVNALGWDLPPGVTDIGLTALGVSSVADKLLIILRSTPAERKDEGVMLQRYADLLGAVRGLISDVQKTAQALATSPTISSDYLSATKIDSELPKRLLDYVIINYVEHQLPLLDSLLTAAGIFEREHLSPKPSLYQVDHVRYTIKFDRVRALLSAERSLPSEVYGWGTSAFDAERFLLNLGLILQSFGGVVRVRPLPKRVEEKLLGTAISPTAAPNPQLLITLVRGVGWDPMEAGLTMFGLRPTTSGGSDGGFAVAPFAKGTTILKFPLSSDLLWNLEIECSLNLSGGVVLTFRPNQAISIKSDVIGAGNPTTIASGRVGLRVRYGSEAGKRTSLILIPGGPRLEAQFVYAAGGAETESGGAFGGFVEFGLVGGRVVVKTGQMDSFLAKLLPAGGVEADVDLRGGWSTGRGLYFEGSGGLETAIPINKALGPVALQTLHLRLRADQAGLKLGLSVSATGLLGPLVVSVDRVGLAADIAFKAGNLGPVDASIAFKPPNGLGLRISAGPVTGGGFISLDYERGRYSGILQLRIAEIAITAIGLLDTKLSGGQTGFSFLIIIFGKFPPIQLGFGFTLNGVGGLAGIQRALVKESLQTAVRSGHADHLLFPEDPIRDAVQITSDLSTIFPPTEGRYVFGPMAILAYGTPTLLEAELGVILALPDPLLLVILGQLNAHLPTKEEAVVELHLDVVGVLDFGRKTLEIDALLHDSRIAAFQVSGGMALRLAWGDNPAFAMSVGGLHPAFQPPAGFPELGRLTFALGDGGNPRFTLQAYFALTSNTVQFGAKAELYAEASGFSVAGWLGFDVLISSPFSLLAQLGAAVTLRRGSTMLATISLQATLTGATPWHLWGQAKLDSIISVTLPFDYTIGEDVEEQVPEIDPAPLLKAALEDPRNWSATRPPAGFQVVAVAAAQAAAGAGPLLDPLGGATVRQRVVPLNRTITRFGDARPTGADRYAVGAVTLAGAAAATVMAQEYFAPAQFQNLSDADKLSRPSFELMDAGVMLASDAIGVGVAIGTDVRFNTVVAEDATRTVTSYTLGEAQQLAALGRSASAQAPLGTSGLAAYAPPAAAVPLVQLRAERYRVVDVDTLGGDTTTYPTKGAAYDALDEQLARDPRQKGRLQVVPDQETA